MPKRDRETYTIHIDGRWSLEDLYIFPRAYEQVYFAVWSLLPDHDKHALERIHHAYRAFPWQGGYSAVNFYNQLKFVTPPKERPQVVSIRYESPGWLEIGLILAVAYAIEKLVKSLGNTIGTANDVYDRIMRGMQERQLLRLEAKRKELEFKRAELRFIEESARLMAQMFGFRNIEEIHDRTGHPYITLKILLSLYRRLRTLVNYEKKNKADFKNEK